MKTISIHDAKTNLSKYIAQAKRGETIYIGSHGKPEIKLVVESPKKPKRTFGVLKDKLSSEVISPSYSDHNDPEWQQLINIMSNNS